MHAVAGRTLVGGWLTHPLGENLDGWLVGVEDIIVAVHQHCRRRSTFRYPPWPSSLYPLKAICSIETSCVLSAIIGPKEQGCHSESSSSRVNRL
jgi:hypothetical protein